MGAKNASLHFRTDDPEALLPALKTLFSKAPKADKQSQAVMELIRAMGQMEIDKMPEGAAKAERQQALADFMADSTKITSADSPRAIIVLSRYFVSLYWEDKIRVENLGHVLGEYAAKLDLPAMGVALYDDTNFVILAVKNAGKPNKEECQGIYWFDEHDIRPIKAADLCRVLDADFLRLPFEHMLRAKNGEAMAELFERGTNLPIMLYPEDCPESELSMVAQWPNADVYHIV